MGMIAIWVVLGCILGAGAGSQLGVVTGAFFGLFIGFTVHALLWMRAHSGNNPTMETHRLICVPSGTFADCELKGDLGLRRWTDVKKCSLRGSDAEVNCDKTCLRMMNDSGVRPGAPCTCH